MGLKRASRLSKPVESVDERVIGLVQFILDLNVGNLNDSIRYKKIVDYPHDQVTSLSVGSQSFYLLAPD